MSFPFFTDPREEALRRFIQTEKEASYTTISKIKIISKIEAILDGKATMIPASWKYVTVSRCEKCKGKGFSSVTETVGSQTVRHDTVCSVCKGSGQLGFEEK